jgi:pyruvate formate lyase activating enzyme
VVEQLGPDVPWHFTAFHPDYRLRGKAPTSHAVLARAREIAVRHGVHYVYTGNVHDRAGQSTYCSGCDATLIGRDWYELSEWNLSDDGHCRSCGTRCPGVFEGPAGTWGSRRMPVRLAKAFGNQK